MNLTTELQQAVALPGAPCHVQGKTPTNPTSAYSVLHPSTGTPERRYLDGRTPHRRATPRLMAVSNNADGARTLATALVDTVDGLRLTDGTICTVEAVGPVLEDTNDPSTWRWTVTIEIHHHT